MSLILYCSVDIILKIFDKYFPDLSIFRIIVSFIYQIDQGKYRKTIWLSIFIISIFVPW